MNQVIENKGYRRCENCNSHLYALYFGGKKETLPDYYWCKVCKTIAHVQFEVKSKPLPQPFFLDHIGTKLEHDLALGTFNILRLY